MYLSPCLTLQKVVVDSCTIELSRSPWEVFEDCKSWVCDASKLLWNTSSDFSRLNGKFAVIEIGILLFVSGVHGVFYSYRFELNLTMSHLNPLDIDSFRSVPYFKISNYETFYELTSYYVSSVLRSDFGSEDWNLGYVNSARRLVGSVWALSASRCVCIERTYRDR